MQLSDLIISNPEAQCFQDLTALVVEVAKNGERFLHFDVKPDYRDTPANWELKLEAAFYWGDRIIPVDTNKAKPEGGAND